MNLILSPKTKASLMRSVEMSIDMLNDMALDDLRLTPAEIREMAVKSDDEIRSEMSKLASATYDRVDELVNLELLLSELQKE